MRQDQGTTVVVGVAVVVVDMEVEDTVVAVAEEAMEDVVEEDMEAVDTVVDEEVEAVVMVEVVMVVTEAEAVMEVEDVMVDTEVDAMVVATEGDAEEEAMEVVDTEASTAALLYAAFKMLILYFSNVSIYSQLEPEFGLTLL